MNLSVFRITSATSFRVDRWLCLVVLLTACSPGVPSPDRGTPDSSGPRLTAEPLPSDVTLGSPEVVWTRLEAAHLHGQVRSLEVLAARPPHPLLAHEVRAIRDCATLEEALTSTLEGPPPRSVVEAVTQLARVCSSLNQLEVTESMTESDAADLAQAMSELGDLLWPESG